MTEPQPGILDPVPALARYMVWSQPAADASRQDLGAALQRLATLVDGRQVVLGLGLRAVQALGAQIDGLHELPADVPGTLHPAVCTPAALWCWLRGADGDDSGSLLHLGRRIEHALAPALRLPMVVDAFRHREGRDLTGYEDGTENPTDDHARAVALVQGRGSGLDGSSFVAVQQWVHNFDRFEAMPADQQDASIGRRRSDNEELDHAPASAHVRRTAQEDFSPEAFSLRRSMPWAQDSRAGLMFVSFGHSLDAFETQWRRMLGADDGVADALFGFTRPVTGLSAWCPPLHAGRADLRALRL